jgi:uncharacterized transporter YbjL
VGLSSGSILIRTFRRQLPLMAGSALVLLVVGAGMVLLGLVSLPLGSVTLSLGVAAGPLVAGIVLGWLERTGPIVRCCSSR